jgi:alkylation response protein AidB-like acyl-CoA dehydrogenase
MQLTRRERREYLQREPRIETVMNSLQGLGTLPRAILYDVATAVALARKFNDRVVRPVYRDLDLRVLQDHEYLPHDFIRTANEWGLFSLWIPKLFGGGGLDLLSLYPFLEEIASVCVGLANVIGVHYLGIGTLSASWNVRLMDVIFRAVSRASRQQEACLISLAITEPLAGTDVEEPELLKRARVGTIATRVDGGYVINGRKVFISNGHVSTWHMVIAYGDRRNPLESSVIAAVKTGTAGFSFGTKEKKMGQRACVASELIFEDCFVPDALIGAAPNEFTSTVKSQQQIGQNIIDFVVSSSRAGVAAFATGAARGAYETALEFARRTHVRGELLINHQWAQIMLADMYTNANTARALYLESAYANALKGMFKPLYQWAIHAFTRRMPAWYFTVFCSPLLRLPAVTKRVKQHAFESYRDDDGRIASGWASIAKFSCSDLAMRNCDMAIELMGAEGLRHDGAAEKYLRDAKLLQIYEGTNQLNRLNLLKNMVVWNMPEARVFE